MGFLGLFKHGNKADGFAAKVPAEEPEFLKEIENTVIPKGTVREEVEPELALWLSNGTTVKSLKELASALKKISANGYKEHVSAERNEVAEWVQEILNDEELARRLRKAQTKLKSAKCVEKRIKELKAAQKAGKRKGKLPKTESTKAKDQFPGILEIPPITELPLPEEARKPGRTFWPFKRKKQDEPAEKAILPLPEIPVLPEKPAAENEGLPQLPEIPSAPEGIEAKPETAQSEFEPEPHHASWEEPLLQQEPATATAPEEKAGKAEAKTAHNRQPRKPRQETKSYQEAALERKEQDLEGLEKGLDREEDELNKKRLEVTRKRYELIKQKGGLEKEKFELFMKKQELSKQKQESLTDSQELGAGAAAEVKGMPDFRLSGAYGKERVEALLEEAKQHIRQNNVEEAKKALQEVQSVFSTTFMPSSDKKQMEYEILEVEADLKLASLS